MRPDDVSIEDVDHYKLLDDIAVEYDISINSLRRWTEKDRDLGFPEPVVMGKYKLYHEDEVMKWLALWRTATKNMQNGDKLNGTRTDG